VKRALHLALAPDCRLVDEMTCRVALSWRHGAAVRFRDPDQNGAAVRSGVIANDWASRQTELKAPRARTALARRS
jgi:hypothetical protein